MQKTNLLIFLTIRQYFLVKVNQLLFKLIVNPNSCKYLNCVLVEGFVHVKLMRPGEGFDCYRYNKVTTCVHNLFGGQRWVDQYGELKITSGHITCKLTFNKVRSALFLLGLRCTTAIPKCTTKCFVKMCINHRHS